MKTPSSLLSIRFDDVRKAVRHSDAFFRSLLRRFLEDECLVWAGMLCYASLLALVPLMVVTLGVASAFPVFEQWSGALRDFIFANFVPTTGDLVQSYLDRFVEGAANLSAVGVLFLILTSLLLIVNIERILNRIWRADSPRSLASRFVVYWAVLTVGPLLVGASIAISSYLVSLPFVEQAATTLGLRRLLLQIAPLGISAVAFTLLYLIVPNLAVPWRHAVAGGVVAGLLFELAKAGFAFYVANFPTYETVYGAFAALPIFLVWVYLSWTVTLIGASFGATLFSYRFSTGGSPWARRNELLLVCRFLRHLGSAQQEGTGLTTPDLLEKEPRAGHDQTERLLSALRAAQIVVQTDSGTWVLSRDLDDLTLLELYRLLSLPLPTVESLDENDEESEAISDVFRELESSLEANLERPLSELL